MLMDLSAGLAGRYVRILAMVTLLLGLNDAARLLGVAQGDTSPISTLGVAGFSCLAVFALALLFAAVGLWIRASWGGVLLAAATAVELGLYISGNGAVHMSVPGFILRLALLASIFAIFVLSLRLRLAEIGD